MDFSCFGSVYYFRLNISEKNRFEEQISIQKTKLDSLDIYAKKSVTKLDSIHTAIINLDKTKFSDLSLAEAVELLSKEYFSIKIEITDIESKGQSGGITAETVGDAYNVESKNQSGGITAGKVDIAINPEKPKLVILQERTKVEITDGEYKKKFYFHNPDGLVLQNVYLKVTFDKDFISVMGTKWVWTGMIATGSEKTQPDQTSRSMVFYTAVLEAVAFIEVTVTSKFDILITDVVFKTQ